MNKAGFGFVVGLTCVALFSPLGRAAAQDRTGAPVESETINLIEAVQGVCLKPELSTDRGCVVPPRIKKQVQPRFPKAARRAKERGRVILGATVEPDGSVGSVTVLDSTNPGYGFEESAIAAMRRWRYEPARLGDVPLRVYFKVTIDFTLVGEARNLTTR